MTTAAGKPPVSLRCCVPYCKRSMTKNPKGYFDWICSGHWRLAPPHWRRRYALFVRRGRPELAVKMWDRIKALVIERAAGLL